MYISMYYNITVVIYMEKISETCAVGWVEFCTDLLADMLEQDIIKGYTISYLIYFLPSLALKHLKV